jgi:hypothetical protein
MENIKNYDRNSFRHVQCIRHVPIDDHLAMGIPHDAFPNAKGIPHDAFLHAMDNRRDTFLHATDNLIDTYHLAMGILRTPSRLKIVYPYFYLLHRVFSDVVYVTHLKDEWSYAY